jgi:hypothetical protein
MQKRILLGVEIIRNCCILNQVICVGKWKLKNVSLSTHVRLFTLLVPVALSDVQLGFPHDLKGFLTYRVQLTLPHCSLDRDDLWYDQTIKLLGSFALSSGMIARGG